MLGDSAVLGTGGGGSGDAVAAPPVVGGGAAASGGAHEGGANGGGGSNSGDDRVEDVLHPLREGSWNLNWRIEGIWDLEGEKEEVSVGHTIKKKGENAKNVLGGVHSVGEQTVQARMDGYQSIMWQWQKDTLLLLHYFAILEHDFFYLPLLAFSLNLPSVVVVEVVNYFFFLKEK